MQRARIAAFVVLIGVAALGARHMGAALRDVSAPGAGRSTAGGAVYPDSVRARRDRILRQIDDFDTYIPAMLLESDSMLRRWPQRVDRPLTVYLGSGDAVGATAAHEQAVRMAFDRWQRVAAIPVQFVMVRDSANADVRIQWIDAFAMRRAGQADVAWNQRGWLIRATLTLATHTTEGYPLKPDAVYTVALHEVGHLLGLGHSDVPDDVMYPSTSVHDLTARDRRSAQVLYALPPGSLRTPASR